MWLKLTTNYSPNFSLPKRKKKTIKFIIIHYTGMIKEKLAIEKLCDNKSGVSAHYFIKKNGYVINLVPDLYEAWHAGKSRWGKFKSLNKNSIGIEIQNPGHENRYEKFTSMQITVLKKLLKGLVSSYRINKKNILGHSDIAPYRKMDPGEKFPWKNLSKYNLALWHNLNDKKIKKFRLLKLNKKDEKKFLKIINKIGYKFIGASKLDHNKTIIKAFQRRFRQSLINGIADKECLMISQSLLKQ
tara:strand:+ start:2188 stop:2916 length:729 start_codon:yes stop_codon:yes gene_type:complete